MRVHDAEHDFKNSLFKVMGYDKYWIQIFSNPQISDWSVVGAFGRWPNPNNA